MTGRDGTGEPAGPATAAATSSPPSARPAPLRLVSSRAPEELLRRLAEHVATEGWAVVHEAGGGVDVARRLRSGERTDLVVLAERAVQELEADGTVLAGSLRALFRSDVALAVPAAAEPPALVDDDDLTRALCAATRIAYSTGPSGTALLGWLERSGLADRLSARLVQAPAGTPVARLLADGGADLGVQQASELADVAGVRLVGPLPGSARSTSTFVGAVATRSDRPDDAGAVLRLLTSAPTDLVLRHRMRPVGEES